MADIIDIDTDDVASLCSSYSNVMGHYLDAICGVSQTEYFHGSSDMYDFATDLLNNYMYDAQLINHGGELSENDAEWARNYKVGENDNRFDEGFAELLRADMVDHEVFVKAIGQENYDILFKGLQESNSKYPFDYSVSIGEDGETIVVGTYKDEDSISSSYMVNGLMIREKTVYDDGVTRKCDIYYQSPDGSMLETPYVVEH